jgi:PIN domain nuclease of toxin-antitoxin system
MWVIDTHVLEWTVITPHKLGARSRRMIASALEADALCVSAASFWEIAQHANAGRLLLKMSTDAWRMQVLALGIREIPLDGVMAIRADGLLGAHRDPGDRFIAATALVLGATLVTADQTLLDWKSPLTRQNAKE